MDYLNEKYDLQIPEGEYTTLGGYIFHAAERVPTVGESIQLQRFQFLIKGLVGARIEEVELRILPEDE